jgi:hypothetical protein
VLKKFIIGLVLILLLFVSLFPRSIEVLNGNPVFEIDQGRDYIAVKNIVVNRKLTLIGAELGAGQAGLQYLFHGPGYFYLLTLPFILFNGNPVGSVILMPLLGLSSIALSIYFVTKLLGWKEGIIMGFLVALCPFFIGQSRFIENHFPTPVFILFIFYFVYRLTKDPKNIKYIFLAAFFSAGIYNFEFALAIPLSITLILYSFILFGKKIKNYIHFLLLGFFFGFIPMVLFEVKHGFMGSRFLFAYLFNHQSTHSSSFNIFIQAKKILDLMIYSFSDSFAGRLILPANIIIPLFIALLIFVFYKERDRVLKKFFLFILLLYPINFCVFLILRNIVFQHYIIDLFLANLLLFTYCFSWLYKNKYSKLTGTIFIYLIALVFMGTRNAYLVSTYDYFDYGGVHKLKGKTEAIDFIFRDAGKKQFGLLVFAPPVYTYPYDYLIWWLGTKKYRYVPNQDKTGTFYLLIEKDLQKPWSYIGWEQTVIKTGKVIFTKVMPNSGLIVEKRMTTVEEKN